MIRVEAVTVCVGYGDILAVTMAENLPLLDSLLVVTSKSDEETKKVCKRHSVPYIATDEFKRDGPFNKARMIRLRLRLHRRPRLDIAPRCRRRTAPKVSPNG